MSEGNNNITIGQLTESINNKMDRDGSNAETSCIFVVSKQDPTAANDYTWYRKYSDGWVEQGGRYTNTQNIFMTMPVEMSDTNYSVVLTYETNSTINSQYGSVSISTSKTTTSFTIRNAGSIYGGWQVSGIHKQN